MEDASIQTVSKEEPIKKLQKRLNWSGMAFIIGFAALLAFLYFDRNNGISGMIHSFGASGVIGAVLMMALLCATPFPSEGLLIMYLKIYGVFWGISYSLLGYTIGSIAVYFIARFLAGKAIHSWTSDTGRFNVINTWISRKGTVALLIVRLLPIPSFVVNMVTGILPSVSFWKYLWTGVVGIIPYYIGVSLIFLGLFQGNVSGFLIGLPVLIILWLLGYWVHHRWKG